MKSLKDRVALVCFDVLGESIPISIPAHSEFGDYCVNVMQLAQRPDENHIAGFINTFSSHELFSKVERKGAYLNFFINPLHLLPDLADMLENPSRIGTSDMLAGKTWAVEHTSPNPNKAMHLGHLRNNVLSMALVRLWEKVGARVICDAVDNNRGIAIARLMWGFLHFAHNGSKEYTTLAYWYDHQDEWHTPESRSMNPGKFVDELYVKASARYEESDAVKEEVRQLVIDWEQGDEQTLALWNKVISYSHAGQNMTLKRLHNRWDMVWHEHEHFQKGKEYVEAGLQKGIFQKTSEGTVITQLEKFDLTDTVVLKSDNTSLYITQDIALTDLKIRTHHADKLIWVIGPEQSLALRQLFAVCEQLGIGTRDQFEHISYGWMSLKGQGSMSSRKGNVVYIDDLLDDAAARASREIRHPDQLLEPLEDVAEKVGVGAVKYALLRVGRNQGIAFDMEESVRFEGNSGPYIQYAYARMQSVLRKAGDSPIASTTTSMSDADARLLTKLAQYTEVVSSSALQNAPHDLALYIYQLTQMCNVFYESESILQSADEQKAFKLGLIQAASFVLKDALGILGIDVVEAM